jgi:TonB-dependent receptor
MKKILIAITLFGISFTAWSQKGFVRGMVTDGDNGEALIGATISKEGTTTGTAADFSGNYSLSLEPGVHNIVFQFVSYQTKVVSGVIVKSGETTSLNMILSSEITELESVVITAEQAKDTEVALLTLQRKSANMVDGISAQTFKKVGDSDLSGAMKRVTGVTVQGGKYVYVRGLGDRYTKTTLNDMTIPGLDPDRNAVQIDLFPTNSIENVVIFKTFSPDISGDFTGGIVNVETKEYPDEKSTNITLGLGYNPSMNLNNDFITYNGGKTDFLGFDDGSRKLPFNKNTIIQDVSSNDKQLEVLTGSFDKELSTIRKNSFLNSSASFSHGNLINKDKVTFGYNMVLNYRKNYEYYSDVEFGFLRKSNSSDQNELVRFTKVKGELGNEDVLWSALLSGAMKFDNHNLSATVFRSQNGVKQASSRINQDFDQTGATLIEDILAYTQRSVTSTILVGKHNFDGFDIEWRNALTFSRQYEPDFRESKLAEQADGGLKFDQGDGAALNRFYRDLNEVNESFKADLTIPFWETSKLKFGGNATLKKRDFQVSNYFFNMTNPDLFSGNLDDFLATENVWNTTTLEGSYVNGNTEPANQYNSTQSVFGLYGMTDMRVSQKLRTIFGLRAEQANMFYTGQNNQGTLNYNDEETLNELNLLPSLNLVYQLAEGMNLRASYNYTLARPSFREKSIAQIYDPITKLTFVGNLDLEQTNVINYDLRWEYFYSAGQMFSVSGFYKEFDGHIELVSFPTAPDNVKPRNAGDSKVYGIEFEMRKNLDFITPALSNLSMGANASFVKSALDIKSVQVDNNGTTEFELREKWARDGETINETRGMSGQAPYLVNAYLNYSNNDGSINANLSYNVQGETLYIVGSGRVPDVYTKPFNSLNFNMYKNFGLAQKSRVTVGVQNILNAERENFYKSYKASDEIFSIFRPGQTFSVKYSYTF